MIKLSRARQPHSLVGVPWLAGNTKNGGFNSVAQLSEIGMSQKQVDNFLKRNVVVELTQITA